MAADYPSHFCDVLFGCFSREMESKHGHNETINDRRGQRNGSEWADDVCASVTVNDSLQGVYNM